MRKKEKVKAISKLLILFIGVVLFTIRFYFTVIDPNYFWPYAAKMALRQKLANNSRIIFKEGSLIPLFILSY